MGVRHIARAVFRRVRQSSIILFEHAGGSTAACGILDIGATQMPIYLDRHDLSGMTAADIAEAHRKDLELQDAYGVRFLTYWFDQARGTAFCLIDSPDIDTAIRVHRDAHGSIANHVIEVPLSAVEAFLGRVADPPPSVDDHAPVDGAFRAIMFTDIVDSTEMTARLGNVRAVEMVRAHDGIVRRALTEVGGREVKHTGDGIMASFGDVAAAVACACAIQQAFAAFNHSSSEPLKVRIGIDAGEPVEDNHDLFGATVQMAARLCHNAAPETTLVSDTVRGLLADSLRLRAIEPRQLKGFASPINLYEVAWR